MKSLLRVAKSTELSYRRLSSTRMMEKKATVPTIERPRNWVSVYCDFLLSPSCIDFILAS